MNRIDFPDISVVIPTYNYAQYITDAMHSILQQDYPQEKIEIIVVDDGSTDNTKDLLKEFIQNKAIQYFFQENKGKASATYNAIQRSTGKYIFNLDADDYFLPQKIKRTVEIFESDESIVHVASPAQIFEQESNIVKGTENLPTQILETKISGEQLLKYFYNNNILYGGGSTFSARSSVLKKIKIPAEVDMYIDEFLILAVLPFGRSFFTGQSLSVWRVHTSNYSGNKQDADQRRRKAKRLLKSSEAVLSYIRQNNFDKSLVKIYELKHTNRQMATKEMERTKNLKDILNYASEVFLNIKPGWKAIKKYQVLNRLLPLSLYTLFKRIAR